MNCLCVCVSNSIVGANLLNLGASAGGVKEQVAQLARVGLDVDGAFRGAGVALEDQDLVLGPQPALEGIHVVSLCVW